MAVDGAAGAGWVVDKNRYFTTLELIQRLDLIFHLIENIEIIPLIRGPEGSGKSALAMQVRQSAPATWSLCLLEADAALSPERLLANISRCFGCVEQQKDGLEGLVNCFEIMRDEGQVPVLLIDDAQLLPATALITLLRLFERQRTGEPLVSILLFADEQIDLLLATPQLRIMTPQAIQIIDLPRLTREDATRYMQYLLQREGVPVDMAVDEARLTRLYRATQGLPGPLGQSILDVLGERKSLKADKSSLKPKPVLFGVLGLTLLGTMLLLQDQINQFFVPTQSDQADVPLSTTADPTAESSDVIVPSGGGFLGGETINPESAAGIPQQMDRVSEADQSDIMSDLTIPASRDTDKALESMANQPQTSPSGENASLEEHDNQQVAEVSGAEVEVAGSDLALDAASTVSVPEPNVSSPETKKSTEPAPDTATLPVIHGKPTPPSDSLAKVDWIRSRPANHYTLQLLGVEHLQALKDFVARHGLQDRAFYYVTSRRGKPWHPLLWGDFPDKKSAIDGSEQLPAAVKNQGYWIRQFKELQAQLDKD